MLSVADSVTHFAHSRSTVTAFALFAALAVVVACSLRRRRAAFAATGVALAGVCALTLPPAGGWWQLLTAHWDLAAAGRALHPNRDSLLAWSTGTDGPLNVALFVPLAAAATVLTGRPLRTAVACVLLSVGIETYQAASGLRVGSAADVVSNGLGALLGACLGGGLLLLRSVGSSLHRDEHVTAR